MIIKPIPKDLGSLKSKLIGPFSGRQVFFLAVAILGVFTLNKFCGPIVKDINKDLMIPINCLVLLPCAFMMVPEEHLQGMKPEQYLKKAIGSYLFGLRKLPYATENQKESLLQEYNDLKKIHKEEVKAAEFKAMTRKERKEAKKFTKSLKGVK